MTYQNVITDRENYFKEQYKITIISLSEHQVLDADPRAIKRLF